MNDDDDYGVDPEHRGLHYNRVKLDHNVAELTVAQMWSKLNNEATSTLDYLLHDSHSYCGPATKRDRRVAATVIQWLGSPVGMEWLERSFAAMKSAEDQRLKGNAYSEGGRSAEEWRSLYLEAREGVEAFVNGEGDLDTAAEWLETAPDDS